MTLPRIERKNQISLMQNEQTAITFSLWKFAAIASTAAIGLIVATAFTAANTLNSDHFLTVSNTDRISAIEKTTVRQDVLTEQLSPMREDIKEIKADIKQLLREH